ncbi:MAG: glycosyltransferase family 4 protein [Myxococcota bacterium]
MAGLRILQVTRVFWPNIGGIEKHVQWLSERLVERGHVCDVVTLDRSFADGSPYPPYAKLGGVNVYRIPFAGSTRYPVAPRVLRFVGRYDVVHVHAIDFLADWLTLTKPIHGRPVVLSTHGGFFHTDFAPRLKKIWFHVATRALVHRVDRLLFTSDQDAELFAKITKRGETLRSAVDLRPWSPLRNEPEPGKWVTVGRVDTHKGIAHLVRALAAVRDRDPRPFRAEILGPEVVPGLVDELTRLRDSLGLQDRVVFRGKVSFDELRDAVRTAELGLFPAEYESFGLSVVEAMAAGVVPVLNDIRAFRYFCDPGRNGFVVDFKDPAAAAAAILAARDLGARRAAVSDEARRTAAKYDWDYVVGDIERVYADLVASRRRSE